MRVCILLESYLPVAGGMESQAYELARALSDREVAVNIITRRSRLSFPAKEKMGNVEIVRIHPPAKVPLSRWLMALNALPALLRRSKDFDIVFVAGFRTLGLTAVIFRALAGKKVVLKAESSGEMSGEFFHAGLKKAGLNPDCRIARALFRRRTGLLARAEAFVSLSSVMTREFVASGIAPDRIHQIPNMVDTGKFVPCSAQDRLTLRKKLSLPCDSKLVIYSGRIVKYKGILDLIRAWTSVRRDVPELKLLIVGSGGDDIFNCETEMRELIQELHLEDGIILTGQVDNVHEYLQCADIFVLPSENEALPISIIEAMSCRLPVIACPAGGVRDIIEDGVEGTIIPFRSPEAIAEAVVRMASNPSLHKRLSEAGYKKVIGEYSPARISERYIQLFRKLLTR